MPTPTPDDLAESAIAAIPEHSSEALLVLDHQLTILAVNRVFEDMVGRHASRLVGHSWAEVFPKTADSVVGAQLRHVFRTGAAVQFEAPSAVIEGRHYAFTAYPHEHGVAALIVNRTAEFALRDQLEEYRGVAATFALLGDAAYVRLNLRGFVEGGSPQVAQLLGIDPKARPHTPFADLLEPDCRVATLERLDVILAGGEASRAPAILRGRDGRVIPVSLAIAPIWRGPAADGAAPVSRARLRNVFDVPTARSATPAFRMAWAGSVSSASM